LRATERSCVETEQPASPRVPREVIPTWLEDHARQRASLDLRTASLSYRAREISLALGVLVIVADVFLVLLSSGDHGVLATGGLMGAGIALISVATRR
jgi:hypothetical protein